MQNVAYSKKKINKLGNPTSLPPQRSKNDAVYKLDLVIETVALNSLHFNHTAHPHKLHTYFIFFFLRHLGFGRLVVQKSG